jgi:hypothetical protein
MPTLDVNVDNVRRLIQLAETFHAQEEAVIEDEPTSLAEDWPRQILASHAGDSTLDEFRTIIEDLDRSQQEEVVALLWLGRGDYDVEDWYPLLREVNAAWTPHTADYLIAHPLLPSYLADGLELLGYTSW